MRARPRHRCGAGGRLEREAAGEWRGRGCGKAAMVCLPHTLTTFVFFLAPSAPRSRPLQGGAQLPVFVTALDPVPLRPSEVWTATPVGARRADPSLAECVAVHQQPRPPSPPPPMWTPAQQTTSADPPKGADGAAPKPPPAAAAAGVHASFLDEAARLVATAVARKQPKGKGRKVREREGIVCVCEWVGRSPACPRTPFSPLLRNPPNKAPPGAPRHPHHLLGRRVRPLHRRPRRRKATAAPRAGADRRRRCRAASASRRRPLACGRRWSGLSVGLMVVV